MAARRKKKAGPAELIISKSRTKGATRKCNVASDFYGALDGAVRDMIKKAVESLFDVKVKAVNTLVRKGKVTRFRNREGRLNDVKKAIVTLEEGHSIDVTTGH